MFSGDADMKFQNSTPCPNKMCPLCKISMILKHNYWDILYQNLKLNSHWIEDWYILAVWNGVVDKDSGKDKSSTQKRDHSTFICISTKIKVKVRYKIK